MTTEEAVEKLIESSKRDRQELRRMDAELLALRDLLETWLGLEPRPNTRENVRVS